MAKAKTKIKRVPASKKTVVSQVASLIGNENLSEALNDPTTNPVSRISGNIIAPAGKVERTYKSTTDVTADGFKELLEGFNRDVDKCVTKLRDNKVKEESMEDPIDVAEDEVLKLTQESWALKRKLINAKNKLENLYVKAESSGLELKTRKPNKTNDREKEIKELRKEFDKLFDGKLL